MLTGDTMNGPEAVACGWASRWFPDEALETEVLKMATKIARVPVDIQQVNKRSMHRGMEVMGIRTALRYGTELQALVMHTKESQGFMKKFRASENPSASFTHYRFSPLKLRNGAEGADVNVVHVDRIQLRLKQMNVKLPLGKVITPCQGKSVTFAFEEPQRVDEISFTTAEDKPELDPVRWVFEGSHDGQTWEELQVKDTDFPTPLKRLYTSGVQGLAGGAATKAFTARDKDFGDNRIARQQSKL